MENTDYWRRIRSEGVHSAVDRLTSDDVKAITLQHGAHNYHPLPVMVRNAREAHVFDGMRDYIDCIGSYSAVTHGHLSEFPIETARAQLEISTLTSRAVFTPELALFLEALSRFTGFEMACPMNTGTEAVETAIKLARKWGYVKKKIPHNKAEIVVAEGNFHGRTTTIVGFSSEPQYRENFGPFGPGFKLVRFGDTEALADAITPNTAAVLLEPIQAEAGVIIPPDGYLKSVRQLCSERDVLLIWDEIQTGFGRAGDTFAWQHEDARPDMICLGKALGGGIVPVSAVAGTRQVMEVFQPGDHGSTFGGNPLACSIAVAAMADLEVRDLAVRSKVLGARLKAGLEGLHHKDILEVRGRGLLVGLEVTRDIDRQKLGQAFLDVGLLTKETRHHTYRFTPPLTIDEGIVDEIVRRVGLAFDA